MPVEKKDFSGFTEETMQFFIDLRFHNNLAWFHENHDRYERVVQTPFYALINDLAPVMRDIDPRMETRPHRCMSRINRDIRYSKDKSPYRDHLWFLFRRAGEPRDQSLMYWFGLSVDRLEWGLGFWSENRPVMDQFRRRIAAQPGEVASLIEGCGLANHRMELSGPAFKRIQIPETVPDTLRPWYVSKVPYVEKQQPPITLAFDAQLKEQLAADFTALAPLYRLWRGDADALYEAETKEKEQDAPDKRSLEEW